MTRLGTHARALIVVGGLLLGGLGVMSYGEASGQTPVPRPAVVKERHPEIRGAVRELRGARKHLQAADHDFGGHRFKALKAVDRAIVELEQALKFDR